MKYTRLLGFVVSFAVAPCTCGCSRAYSDAISFYATTASNSARSITATAGMAAEICRKGSLARYVRLRLEGAESVPATWGNYYEAPNPVDGKLSWKEYCDEIQQTGRSITALARLLTWYSETLQVVANGDFASLPSPDREGDVVPAHPGAKTLLAKSLLLLAPPAEKLGRMHVSEDDALTVSDLAIAADPHVQAIFDGLLEYIDLIDSEVIEPTKTDRRAVLGLIESKTNVWTAPLDVSRTAAFVSYATSVTDDMESAEMILQRYATLIGKLKEAHTMLVHRPKSRASAREITKAIAGIVALLARVETAVSARFTLYY